MTIPPPMPKEEPRKDVGSALKQRRMLRGQSLETAHQHTRIPKRFLQAMEENAFDVLPAPVYLRGFLKSYCDFLDLEFDPLWAQLAPKPPADTTAGAAPAAAAAGGAPEASKASAAESPENAPSPVETPSGGPALGVSVSDSTVLPILIFAGLLLMAALLWVLKSKRPASREAVPAAGIQAQQVPTAAPAPVLPGPTLPASTGPVPAAEAALSTGTPPLPAPRAEQGTLRLTALRATWVRLEADGRLMFEGHLPGGTTQDFRARRMYSLRAEDLKSLSVTLDGAPVDLPKLPARPDGTRTILRG